MRRLTTETGAGQWGSALAFATAQYGMECEIWMVAVSYLQKPHRRTMMEVWGATVHSSPSDVTDYGRSLLAENPEHTGSLGIAISEAVAMAAADPDSRYALGSVLNHVLMHQTIIGEEALLQPAGSARPPTSLSAAPVAAPTSAVSRSPSCARSSPAGSTRRSAASSPPPARASPRASTATTSAIPPG